MLHLDERLHDKELSLLAQSGGTTAAIHAGLLICRWGKKKEKKEEEAQNITKHVFPAWNEQVKSKVEQRGETVSSALMWSRNRREGLQNGGKHDLMVTMAAAQIEDGTVSRLKGFTKKWSSVQRKVATIRTFGEKVKASNGSLLGNLPACVGLLKLV